METVSAGRSGMTKDDPWTNTRKAWRKLWINFYLWRATIHMARFQNAMEKAEQAGYPYDPRKDQGILLTLSAMMK